MFCSCNNCVRCFRDIRPRITSTKPIQPAIPPRCLLLGPSGSGKTTFLHRIKTGEYADVHPTNGCNVEELLVTSRTSLIFSDVGGSEARREARLHFLNSVPIDDLSILFFIDASAPLEELPCTLDELVYLVSYARSRGGHTKYLGIVINKQDLLTGAAGWHHISHGRASGLRKSGEADKEEDSERAAAVARITAGVEKAMEVVVKSPVMGRGVGEEVETSMKWEVLDGGRPGISAKTGTGVKEVFDTVSRAVFGNDRAGMGLLGIVTGGPTGLG